MTLYAATIILDALLLFLARPIIAEQILPWFGGSETGLNRGGPHPPH